MNPETTIVMPAYNAASTLKKTVMDIPQGFANEIILVGPSGHESWATLFLAGHELGNAFCKDLEIPQILLQDLVNDLRIYFPIQMDQSVSKLDHLTESGQKRLRKYLLLGQDLERFRITLGRPEPFTRNNVIADIEATFHRNLE
jgi:hypothetical protein